MPTHGIGRCSKPWLNDIREEQMTLFFFQPLQKDNQHHFELAPKNLPRIVLLYVYLSGRNTILLRNEYGLSSRHADLKADQYFRRTMPVGGSLIG
jgi:hypothetical protein